MSGAWRVLQKSSRFCRRDAEGLAILQKSMRRMAGAAEELATLAAASVPCFMGASLHRPASVPRFIAPPRCLASFPHIPYTRIK